MAWTRATCLHAVDRVRQVVETGGSLADAADALEADREATSEVESLPLEPGRADVVRLMNLHKAKGLEANVVFLADPAGGVKARADVHIERDGLQARGWLKIVRKSDTSWAETLLGQHADWDTHEQAELPYVEAEEDRLLYVAATRAREMLVVSRWADKPGDGAWGKLNAFLGKARELSVPASVSVPAVVALDCTTVAQTAAEEHRAQAHARVNQPSWSVTSVTEEARHIARMTRSVDASADDPSKVVVADTPSHRADAGQAWGTLVHGLLEHAMRHRTATREDLRRLAMWLTVEEPQLRAVIDEALDTVQAVASGAFWAEAKASTGVPRGGAILGARRPGRRPDGPHRRHRSRPPDRGRLEDRGLQDRQRRRRRCRRSTPGRLRSTNVRGGGSCRRPSRRCLCRQGSTTDPEASSRPSVMTLMPRHVAARLGHGHSRSSVWEATRRPRAESSICAPDWMPQPRAPVARGRATRTGGGNVREPG